MAIRRIKSSNIVLEQRMKMPQPFKCNSSSERIVPKKLQSKKGNRLCDL